MFVDLEIDLLREILDAEKEGAPLTRQVLGRRIHSSTFEDLLARGHITIKGQEGGFLTVAYPHSEYILSEAGKRQLIALDPGL